MFPKLLVESWFILWAPIHVLILANTYTCLYFRTKYIVDFGNKNHSFLDDRTNGRTYAAMLRPSVVCFSAASNVLYCG